MKVVCDSDSEVKVPSDDVNKEGKEGEGLRRGNLVE